MADDIKCPACGSDTSIKTVKKGPDIGKHFYVCNRYPECKGRISINECAKSNIRAGEATNECQESWLLKFLALYNQAAPLIEQVAKLDEKGIPPNADLLLKANIELPPILSSLHTLPKPPQKELDDMRKLFERLLNSCIGAGEATVKMIDDIRAGTQTAARMHYGTLGSFVVMASSFRESLSQKVSSLQK
jgi:hypothetical protein